MRLITETGLVVARGAVSYCGRDSELPYMTSDLLAMEAELAADRLGYGNNPLLVQQVVIIVG